MKKVNMIVALGLICVMGLATVLTGCGKSGSSENKELAIMVPSADHGWTGAVLTYAQEKADAINGNDALKDKLSAKVYAATDVEDQIQQVDDLLTKPDSLAGIVILPYDNGLQSTLEKITSADVPFIQFDRVVESAIIDEKVVANVKGDNEGIGYETAKRFVADGLSKEDYIYEMIGDNSSVPEMRSNGVRKYLAEQGWTDAEIDAVVVRSAATGWSRDTGKELFESWFSSSQCDTNKKNWIYVHDDEIAIGILESMNGSALDETKKAAFIESLQAISAPGGLAETYAIMQEQHKTLDRPTEFDLFSVTYDPAMIQEAVAVMEDYLGGETNIDQNYIIPVRVVDYENVGEAKPYGTYDGK